MRNLLLLIVLWTCQSVWADVQLSYVADNEPIDLEKASDSVIKDLTATSSREVHYDVGFRLLIDGEKYFVKPSLFMAKNKPDETCTPTHDVLAYQCKEGQRIVKGCHLLFFNSRGKWVGFQTMDIHSESPYYCNAVPAMGVANKSKNELLLTMQYFFIDSKGAQKASEVGDGWIRMTTLFRVKTNNGKIEVEQDDSCLGNPNQIDTIAKARKQLQRCAAVRK